MGIIHCPQNDTDYSTLFAFEAAVRGTDFGTKAEGIVSGTVVDTTVVEWLGPYPYGVEVRAAPGEEFDGREGQGAALKGVGGIFANASGNDALCSVEVYDLEIANAVSYSATLISLYPYYKFDFRIERCGIFNRGSTNVARVGVGVGQNVSALVPQNFTMRDCVVVANARALVVTGDKLTNGTIIVERVTCEGYNAATSVCEINEKQPGSISYKDVLALGAGVPDCDFKTAPSTTNYIASEDTTSNVVPNFVTGITTAIFNDYALGDYRIKNTATALIGAGSGGGDIGAFFIPAVGADTTPDAFSFTDQTDVALSTLTTSNTLTITGIDAATAISVTGGEMSINSGAFGSASTTVVASDTVQLRVTSSASNSTAVAVTLDIGGVTDEWSVTTLAAVSGGTITTGPFKNNTGTLQTGLTGLRVVVLNPTDGTTVLNSTGNTTHATTAVLTLSDAALTPATTYGVITLNTAGTVIGAELITAT
jgi:hypothetical protein